MKPAERNKIFKAHEPSRFGDDPYGGKHPLDGKSVADWVAEARGGWPKVPVPGDPFKAAQRVAEKHAGEGVTFDGI